MSSLCVVDYHGLLAQEEDTSSGGQSTSGSLDLELIDTSLLEATSDGRT